MARRASPVPLLLGFGFAAAVIAAMISASDDDGAPGEGEPQGGGGRRTSVPSEPKLERAKRIKALSRATGLEPAILAAIERVESGGNPAAVRFEPHHFAQLRLGRPQFDRKVVADLKVQAARDGIPYTPAAEDPALSEAKRRGIVSLRGPETNLDAYRRAAAIDHEAAVRATSWGWYQTLGWALLEEVPGNPAASEARFWADPRAVSGRLMTRWMAANPRARTAAAAKDWRAFAAVYNGASRVDIYAPRLAAAYTEAAADPTLSA